MAELTVLVTGAASGIGRSISELFLSEGYRVHACDSDAAALQEFLDANATATGSCADVAVSAEVDRLFDEMVSHHDRLDVLVNNAGIAGPTAAIEDIEPPDWDRTLAVNLGGQFLCARRAVPLLKKNGGSIINVASNAAFTGCPNRAPYAASKWGVLGLTKTLAMELGRHDIRVNAICPCSVEGDRIESVLQRDAERLGRAVDDVRQVYQRQSSLRRFVNASDIAAMALFFASDAARNVSGQAVGVDGHTESLASPFDD